MFDIDLNAILIVNVYATRDQFQFRTCHITH